LTILTDIADRGVFWHFIVSQEQVFVPVLNKHKVTIDNREYGRSV